MDCKINKPMLHSYLNNELSISEATAVTKHLEECSYCRREIEEIKKLKVITAAIKIDMIPLEGLKNNIMAAIKITQKVRALSYDIKVLRRLGTSMVACGVIALLLNFTSMGSSLEIHSDKLSDDIWEARQKISQPISVINKGLTEMSDKLIDLNGITFRIKQKSRGGM